MSKLLATYRRLLCKLFKRVENFHLRMPAKPKEDAYDTVFSKKKVQVMCIMSWTQKGSEDTCNFKEDREAEALHLALFGLLVVNRN